MNSTISSRRTGHISSQNNTRSFLMATKSVQLAKAHLTCLYIIGPVYKHLTLCELEKSLNKLIKDVCCIIISPWKKNITKKEKRNYQKIKKTLTFMLMMSTCKLLTTNV